MAQYNITSPSREKTGIDVDWFIERLSPSSFLCLFLVLVWMLHLVGSSTKEQNYETFPHWMDWWRLNPNPVYAFWVKFEIVHNNSKSFQPPVSIGPWKQVKDKPDAHTAGCQISAPTTWLFRSAPAAPHCLLMCYVLASSYQICEEKSLQAAV